MTYDLHIKIRALRRQKRLRQDHVAAQVGVSKSAMCAYESGTRRPQYETLVLLAELYGTTTDFLLGRSDRALDVSGLTAEQYAIVAALVENMTEQNQQLEDLRK